MPLAGPGHGLRLERVSQTDENVVRDLIRRVRAALSEAEAAVARSERLTAARALRGAGPARRCAWCGRLALGRHWTPLEEAPAFVPRDIGDGASHTICPDCLGRLEREGRTRPLRRGRRGPS